MRNRLLLCSLAVMIVFALSASFLAGCNEQKDVYGAASDYIKVSHPDSSDENEFSEVGSDNENNGSSAQAGDKTEASSVPASSDSAGSKNDNSGSSDNGQSVTIGDGIVIPPIQDSSNSIEGDMGPVIEF